MKKSTRMMMMNGKDRDNERERHEYDRNGYNMPEDKFRDRRGREHYDSGRYAPRSESESWMESRYDGRGLEHYDNGRYAPMKSEYGGYQDDRYPMYPTTVPPMYNRYDGGKHRESERMYPMNKIGFSVEGEMERIPEMNPDYKQENKYRHMNEMEYGISGERQTGYAKHAGDAKMDKQMAERWMASMENIDGSHGAHWNMEQAKQVMAQRGIECDPLEFWVSMNMIYSDYAKVAKELGVNNIEFYAKMAHAFLDDDDAMPDKLARYYEYVVRH